MYKHILEAAREIDWMAIVPLLIFVIFFAGVLFRTFREKKEFINHMASLPLEEDDPQH